MIHRVRDGWVISSRGVWLPGCFETRRAARYAFRFSDRTLALLQRAFGDRPVTFAALQEARRRRMA